MTDRVKIVNSVLTKSSKGYPLIKIKLKKEDGRIVYSDYFFSKKSKYQTIIEVLDLLDYFDIKVNRKRFVTPRYLNRKLKALIGKEALCDAKRLYNNIYKRELYNIEKIKESDSKNTIGCTNIEEFCKSIMDKPVF